MMFKFALLTIIIINLVKKLLVEVWPLFESEFLTENSWRNVASDERCFNSDCTRTAHRVDQITIAFPACHQNDTRC